jgi:hypothetical protein
VGHPAETPVERVFDKFPKYHMKILLVDFNAKVGKEDIFKPTIGNRSLHEISSDNGVRLSKVRCSHFVTFINLLGHLLMESHLLIGRRRHSSVLDVRSFRGGRL